MVMQPLPTECQTEQYTPRSSHAGLWYDRFFNHYTAEWKLPDDSSGKQSWIQEISKNLVGDQQILDDYGMRQRQLTHALGGHALQMSSEWNFVTGMGNNHPVENGFAWHHTLGVPYLTGAAVKGMLKGWCEAWTDMDPDTIKQWFGDTDQAGEIIFFDAVPIKPVKLITDIMTPHYGDWYAKGSERQKPDGSNTPADWHDPVPIPFLAVARAQDFQFAFTLRPESCIRNFDIIERLVEALEFMGAGAKTSAGYGRFERDEKREEQLATMDKVQKDEADAQVQKAADQAEMSELELELETWLDANPEPNTVPGWIERMLAANLKDQETIALKLKVYYEHRGGWKKPSKKQLANVKAIKQVLNP